jgi:hypothetical protein
MSSELVVLRYPHGRSEYQFSDNRTPEVGDVLERNGDSWVVQAVAHAMDGSSLVTLRPMADGVEPPAGP